MMEITEEMILEGISSKDFIKVIRQSVDLGGISNMDSFFTLFSLSCFKDKVSENFPEDVFDFILYQMKNEKFQSLFDSHKLLSLFESDWGRLNESQKTRLLEVIKETYHLFKDSISFFILSEILGEYFADVKALKVFDNLQIHKNETAQAFLAYGYGKLAQNTNEENINKIAIDRLQRLKKHSSKIIREEAIKALKNAEY